NVISMLLFDVKTGARGKDGLPLMGLATVAYSGSTILFMNPAMFEAKKVPLPKTDMTFNDLVDTAVKMTERPAGADVASVYGFLESGYVGDVMATWVRDFGGELLSA